MHEWNLWGSVPLARLRTTALMCIAFILQVSSVVYGGHNVYSIRFILQVPEGYTGRPRVLPTRGPLYAAGEHGAPNAAEGGGGQDGLQPGGGVGYVCR